jgi:hypothetical protein
MNWLVGLIAVCMTAFAVVSAIREIQLYRKALRGEVRYLVSRKRLVRRMLISVILLVETGLLVFGFFFLAAKSSGVELLYWMAPLVLVFVLFSLTIRDLHDTRRDVERIFLEEMRDTVKKGGK